VLLVHGADDTAIPPTQSLHLAAALSRAGHRVYTMVTDGGHGELEPGRTDIITFVRRFLHKALQHS